MIWNLVGAEENLWEVV